MDDSDEEIQPLKRKKKRSDTPSRTPSIVKHTRVKINNESTPAKNLSTKFEDNSQKCHMSRKEKQPASSSKQSEHPSISALISNGENPSKSAADSPQKTKMKNEADTSTKALFSSSYNKADQVFFKPRNPNNDGSQKPTFCPVCNINLLFLHGVSPQFHINECLDRNPNFEDGKFLMIFIP